MAEKSRKSIRLYDYLGARLRSAGGCPANWWSGTTFQLSFSDNFVSSLAFHGQLVGRCTRAKSRRRSREKNLLWFAKINFTRLRWIRFRFSFAGREWRHCFPLVLNARIFPLREQNAFEQRRKKLYRCIVIRGTGERGERII